MLIAVSGISRGCNRKSSRTSKDDHYIPRERRPTLVIPGLTLDFSELYQEKTANKSALELAVSASASHLGYKQLRRDDLTYEQRQRVTDLEVIGVVTAMGSELVHLDLRCGLSAAHTMHVHHTARCRVVRSQ